MPPSFLLPAGRLSHVPSDAPPSASARSFPTFYPESAVLRCGFDGRPPPLPRAGVPTTRFHFRFLAPVFLSLFYFSPAACGFVRTPAAARAADRCAVRSVRSPVPAGCAGHPPAQWSVRIPQCGARDRLPSGGLYPPSAANRPAPA